MKSFAWISSSFPVWFALFLRWKKKKSKRKQGQSPAGWRTGGLPFPVAQILGQSSSLQDQGSVLSLLPKTNRSWENKTIRDLTATYNVNFLIYYEKLIAEKTRRFVSAVLSLTGLATQEIKMTISTLNIHCFGAEMGALFC